MPNNTAVDVVQRQVGVRDVPFEAAAVYDVVDGLIRTVWFFAAD